MRFDGKFVGKNSDQIVYYNSIVPVAWINVLDHWVTGPSGSPEVDEAVRAAVRAMPGDCRATVLVKEISWQLHLMFSSPATVKPTAKKGLSKVTT